MNQIGTIVLKDASDNYKVLQVIFRISENRKTLHFYDLFTEEKLFDLPYMDKTFKTDDTYKFTGFDLKKIYNKIPYFDDKKIVEFGSSTCSTCFVENHLDEFRKKDGKDYTDVNDNIWNYMYPNKFRIESIAFTKKRISENYVTTVPNDFRVTPKEMGLTIMYEKEREYADYWKISSLEEQRRMENISLEDKDAKYRVFNVKTLIVTDENNNEKILNATLKYADEYIDFYDLYTGIYLFKIKGNYNTDITKLDFANIEDSIPFFEDKTIGKASDFSYTCGYIYDKIDEYRKRDGINYELPDDGCSKYLTKYAPYSIDASYTVEQYATCYVTIVGEENQVSQSELMMGLEKNKVLVKQ